MGWLHFSNKPFIDMNKNKKGNKDGNQRKTASVRQEVHDVVSLLYRSPSICIHSRINC